LFIGEESTEVGGFFGRFLGGNEKTGCFGFVPEQPVEETILRNICQ